MKPKLKVYLDSTIPNYAFNKHTPEKQQAALGLFNLINKKKVKAFISQVVVNEISNTPDVKKRQQILKILENCHILKLNLKTYNLAQIYIKKKIIPAKNFNDAQHIAIATVYKLNALISYNFEHIIRLKTVKAINQLNKQLGYQEINLVIPEAILND